MIRGDRRLGRMLCIALLATAFAPLASAGDELVKSAVSISAPMELPHVTDLLLAERAHKPARKTLELESLDLYLLKPGLSPVVWPKDSDMRARILTPELKRTPVFGWLAENLYRSKDDNGWCLEVDPGEDRYVVFYRFHPKR